MRGRYAFRCGPPRPGHPGAARRPARPAEGRGAAGHLPGRQVLAGTHRLVAAMCTGILNRTAVRRAAVNRTAVRRRALRERVPVAGAGGFRREEFGAAVPGASPVIFFICPYGTAISTVSWAIRRLCRDGYHVVAYETTTAVFLDGDPAILPGLIAAVRTDLQARIARLKSEGVTEFGFFGSSLGSFIFYNCVGD